VNLGQMNGTTDNLAAALQNVKLKPGQSLIFRVGENQIRNVGEFTFEPNLVAVATKVITPSNGAMGGETIRQYTLRLSPKAKPNTAIHGKSTGSWQMRNSPNWALDFKIKVS